MKGRAELMYLAVFEVARGWGDIVELAGAVRHAKRRCVIETIHEVIGLVAGEQCEIQAVAVEVIRANVKISRRFWVDRCDLLINLRRQSVQPQAHRR